MDKKSKGLQIVFKNKVREIHFLRYTIKKKNVWVENLYFSQLKMLNIINKSVKKQTRKRRFSQSPSIIN
jgi:hypothetical protein